MATNNLQQNFANIIATLQNQNLKLTHIANSMGYTTTTQLHSALDGNSMLSTKAIISLVEHFKINPTYLFLGYGEMFQTEESEIEKLRDENRLLVRNNNEAIKTIIVLQNNVKTLEKRNADLIDLTSAAIKYHQSTDADAEENK